MPDQPSRPAGIRAAVVSCGLPVFVHRSFILSCFFFLLLQSSRSYGQTGIKHRGGDSLAVHLFPIVAYSSDEGVVFGAIFARMAFSGGEKLFSSRLTTLAWASTKGYVAADIKYQHNDLFDSRTQLKVEPYLYRTVNDNYFGIGNETPFSPSLWKHKFYYVETLKLGMDVRTITPLHTYSPTDKLNLLVQGGFAYLEPHSRGVHTKFVQDYPDGLKGKWHNYVGVGLAWDDRDDEHLPTRGNRVRAVIRLEPKVILNDYNDLEYEFQFTHYFPFHLIRDVVVAQRIYWKELLGKAPFWYQPYLGDGTTLRGYPERRFIGRAALIYNLELRTWLFSIPSLRIRIGGQLFLDAGKIYQTTDNFLHFFAHYKHTVGLGGAVSFIDPHFFLRGDLGFSPNLWRIYAGMGYMF